MIITDLFETKSVKKQTLYVSRKLINGEDLVRWAEGQGFVKCLDPSDMHVTVCNSKKEIDVSELAVLSDDIAFDGIDDDEAAASRNIRLFGPDKKAVVLIFEADDLRERWQELCDDYGASWDHDGYHPHITITYDGLPDGLSLDDITPYDGELIFGQEIHQIVNPKWTNTIKEKKTNDWLNEGSAPFMTPTSENIEKAKAFVFKKWKERANELGLSEPRDLSSSCKFTSMFAKAIFGGTIKGNYHHQFLVVGGNIIDLNQDAEDVRNMDNPHTHDPLFFGNHEHKESMATCRPRVKKWVDEFKKSSLVTESFSIDDLDEDEIDILKGTFRDSYLKTTGSSWSDEKLMSRAHGWTFYGDPAGFVAIRKQISGMKKLVAVAGDIRLVIDGLSELQEEGGPIWGAVSNDLARMAKKRGMIVPHLIPGGPTLIKIIAKSIPASVFGGHTPQISSDGGVIIGYDDIGDTKKYFIGNVDYFREVIKNPLIADKIEHNPLAKKALSILGL